MAFRFHVARSPEIGLVRGLERLSLAAPIGAVEPLVFLTQNPHGEGHFLLATDGTVVRSQPVRLFWNEADLRAYHHTTGPVTHEAPLSAWLEDDGQDPLPDLTLRPALLVRNEQANRWDLEFPGDNYAKAQAVAVMLLQHLRPIPAAFRSWLVLMQAGAMGRFAQTFPEGLEPPVLWVPEPLADPQKPSKAPTWAKYWGFHAKTAQPVGVILGVRSRETLERFEDAEKK